MRQNSIIIIIIISIIIITLSDCLDGGRSVCRVTVWAGQMVMAYICLNDHQSTAVPGKP